MDPFNAFVSLSKHILDLAYFGSDLRYKLKSMRKDPDGLTTQHRTLVSLVAHISEEASRLKAHSALDDTMAHLVGQCEKLAEDLSLDLKRLSAKSHRCCREVYRIGLLLWKQNAIVAKAEELHKLHSVIAAYYQGDVFRDHIHKLMEDSSCHRTITVELRRDVERVLSELRTQSQAPSQSLDRLATMLSGLPKIEASVEEIRATGKATNRILETQRERMELLLARPVSAGRIVSDEEILRCLRFTGMYEREETIRVAHRRTYEWIMMDMQPTDSTNPSSNPVLEERREILAELTRTVRSLGDNHFTLPESSSSEIAQAKILQDWLRDDSGIFWINGKPGCGKSTFMKALNTNRTMKTKLLQLLRSWAGDGELLVASYYIFQAGSYPLQRQSEGLLQSLLYQVFSAKPSLVGEIWDQKARREALAQDLEGLPPWSKHELLGAFKAVLNDKTLRVCLLIDGIDEMQGSKKHLGPTNSHGERKILQIMDSLIEGAPHVKILSAGRKSAIFAEYFKKVKTMEFHRLTELDITHYCLTRLSTLNVTEGFDISGSQIVQISSQIIGNASGVFLWVYLVIEMIKQGLLYFESFQQLTARLHELPQDINDLYDRILKSIDKTHLQEMSLWLAVIEMQTGYLSSSPDCIDELEILVLANLFEARDPNSLCKLHMRLKNGEIEALKLDLTQRLLVRCPLFFEVIDDNDRSPIIVPTHRTVLDFLRLSDVRMSLWSGVDLSRSLVQRVVAALFLTNNGWSQARSFGYGIINMMERYKEEIAKFSRTVPRSEHTLASQKLPMMQQEPGTCLNFGDVLYWYLIMGKLSLPQQDLHKTLTALGYDTGSINTTTWSDEKKEQAMLYVLNFRGVADSLVQLELIWLAKILKDRDDDIENLLPQRVCRAGGLWEAFVLGLFRNITIDFLWGISPGLLKAEEWFDLVLSTTHFFIERGADINFMLSVEGLCAYRRPSARAMPAPRLIAELSFLNIVLLRTFSEECKAELNNLISQVQKWGGRAIATSPDGEPCSPEQVRDWYEVAFLEPIRVTRQRVLEEDAEGRRLHEHEQSVKQPSIAEQTQSLTLQIEDSQQHDKSASEGRPE